MVVNIWEYKTYDNFSVSFPEEFKIDNSFVVKAETPKFRKGKWSNFSLYFINAIGEHNLQAIIDICNRLKNYNDFKIFINNVDSCNHIVGQIEIQIEKIVCVDFGTFDTSNNEKMTTKLVLKPLSVKCIY